MKKFLALALTFFVLTGCSWFKKDGAKDPVAVNSTEFDAVMAQMQDVMIQDVLEAFPTANLPLKNASEMTFTGEADLAEAGKANFRVTGTGKSDYTDTENPMGETNIKLAGELKGAAQEGQAEAQSGNALLEIGMKLVNKKFFVSLMKAEASQNGQEFPVAMLVGPYLGKWYGATFEEVNSMLDQASGGESGVDVATAFQKNPNDVLNDMKTRLEPALQQMHIWQLEENLGEENGMLRYKVKFDQEAFTTGLIELARFSMTNPDGTLRTEQFEQAKADIEEGMKEPIDLAGTLSVSKENVRDFSFEGTGTKEGNAIDIDMNREGDKFEMNITDIADEDSTEVADDVQANESMQFTMERIGEKEYNMTLRVPEENSEVNVNNFKYTDRSLSFEIAVKDQDVTRFTGDMDYTVEETSTVQVEEPAAFEPLQGLLSGFLGGMMGAPAGTPPVPATQDTTAPAVQ